jgi:hypothetical protein
MQMQCRRAGKTTSGPKSFSSPSCNLPPLSFSPHRPKREMRRGFRANRRCPTQSDASREPRSMSSALGRVRGSGRGWWGCGGGERPDEIVGLGALCGVSRLPCIAFRICIKRALSKTTRFQGNTNRVGNTSHPLHRGKVSGGQPLPEAEDKDHQDFALHPHQGSTQSPVYR